jgi:hypothetical protein
MPEHRNASARKTVGGRQGVSAREVPSASELLEIAKNAVYLMVFPGSLVSPRGSKCHGDAHPVACAKRRIAEQRRKNLKRVDGALAALVRLEQARLLSLSIRLLFHQFRAITWPLTGMIVWRLFYLKETDRYVFERVLDF